MVSIAIERPRQPDVLELMRLGDEFTLALYPPQSCHLLGVEELEADGVTVFVARDDSAAVGMGAIVDRRDGSAELKRMFVPEAARGRGIAGSILGRIDDFARGRGIGLIQLETGPLQDAAIALYTRNGFTPIPNFGKYVGDPNSICFEKRIG